MADLSDDIVDRALKQAAETPPATESDDIVDTVLRQQAAEDGNVTHLPGESIAGGIGTALDTPGRVSRTMLATQPTAFWKDPNEKAGPLDAFINSNPLFLAPNAVLNMGRNVLQGHLPFGGDGKAVLPDVTLAAKNVIDTEAAPSPNDIKKQFIASDLGTRPGFEGKDGTDWKELGKDTVDAAADFVVGAATDPLMFLHPGSTSAAVTKQGLRAEAIVGREMAGRGSVDAASRYAGEVGAAGKYLNKTGEILPTFKTAQEAASYVIPSRSARIAAGEMQLAPGIPVPKSLALLAKPIDWLDSINLGKGPWLLAPKASDAINLMDKAALDHTKAAFAQAFKETIVPAYRKAAEVLPEAELQRAGRMSEMLDPAGNMRAGPELAYHAEERGFKVQGTSDLPESVIPKPSEALGTADPLRAGQLENARLKGMQHFQKQLAEDLAAISTYTPEQFSASYALMKSGQEYAGMARQIFKEYTGKELNQLNEGILARPGEINKAIQSAHARMQQVESELFDRRAHGIGNDAGDYATVLKPGEYQALSPSELAAKQKLLRPTPAPVADAEHQFVSESNVSHAPTERAPMGTIEEGQRKGGFKGYQGTKETFEFNEAKPEVATPKALETYSAKNSLEELNAAIERPDITMKELTQIKRALMDQRVEAVQKYNAVASYRPGRLSAKIQKEIPRGNSLLRPAPIGSGIESSERSYVFNERSGIEDVKAPVYRAEQEIAAGLGTKALEGNKTVTGAARELWDEFLTKTGAKQVMDDMARTSGKEFFEPNAYKAFEQQAKRDLPRAAANHVIDQGILESFETIPGKAWEAVQRTADRGVTEEGATVRPAKYADLQKVFAENGGKGELADLVEKSMQDRLKTNPQEVFQVGDLNTPGHKAPANRARVMLDGKDVWIHGDVARQVEELKRLGNDPYQMVRWMRAAGPGYVLLLQQWKKLQTFMGPQFFAYNMRNQTGDWTRQFMGNAFDGASMHDFASWLPALAEYDKTGNVAAFAGIKAKVGNAVLSGDQVFKEFIAPSGILGGGELAGDVLRNGQQSAIGQAEKVGMLKQMGGAGAKAKSVIAEGWETAKRYQQARENANRVSAFLTRLRAGDTPVQAGMHVDRVLFDYRRTSGAVQFLRQTGLVPFVSWQSKNIPFVLSWAMEHPGQFMATIRAMDMVSGGQMPASQLPSFLRDKHLVPIGWSKNAKGEKELSIIQDSGILPITDLLELTRNAPGYLANTLSPILKAAFMQYEMQKEEELDQAKYTTGDYLEKTGEALLGRPLSSFNRLRHAGEIDPQTGTKEGYLHAVRDVLFNPAKASSINIDKQAVISQGVARGQAKSAATKLLIAQKDLSDAFDLWVQAQGVNNQAQAISKDDPDFARFQQKMRQARLSYDRHLAQFRQVQAEAAQQQDMADRMTLK